MSAVEEPSFLLERLVVVREFPFGQEVETFLLDTWLVSYPAHPLTIDTRARLLLEKVPVLSLKILLSSLVLLFPQAIFFISCLYQFSLFP